jgi:hypothetical protein
LKDRFAERKTNLNDAFKRKDLEDLVGIMISVFMIPGGIIKRVGTSAKIDSFAVIKTIYIGNRIIDADIAFQMDRDSIFRTRKEIVLFALAHELSHLRFDLDHFKHSRSEFATDLLAILMLAYGSNFSIQKAVREEGLDDITHYGYIKDELYPTVFETIQKHAHTIHL